jgi:hypothetical protein
MVSLTSGCTSRGVPTRDSTLLDFCIRNPGMPGSIRRSIHVQKHIEVNITGTSLGPCVCSATKDWTECRGSASTRDLNLRCSSAGEMSHTIAMQRDYV